MARSVCRSMSIPLGQTRAQLMMIMKVRTLIYLAAAAMGMTSTALSDQYDDLAREGYRWVTIDGPFACASKEDVHRVFYNQSDDNELRMIEQGRAYFLIRGAIVQVIQEDRAAGMSQIRGRGILIDLWTLSKLLSRRPIVDILGTIATPSEPIGANIPGIHGKLGATGTQ